MKKKNLLKIFEKYSKNIFPKVVTKVVKSQVGVACVILFAPPNLMGHEQFKFSIDVNFKHTTQHYKLYNYARYLSAKDFCTLEINFSKNFSLIMNFYA